MFNAVIYEVCKLLFIINKPIVSLKGKYAMHEKRFFVPVFWSLKIKKKEITTPLPATVFKEPTVAFRITTKQAADCTEDKVTLCL